MTLTETVQLTKKSAVFLLIFVSAIFASRAVWSRVRTVLFPPKVPPPEVAFGKLPVLQIPNLPFKESAAPKYVIDTTTGRLPTDLPDRAKVYKIILPKTTLLAGSRAKELAAKLGFTQNPQKISSSEYRWENPEEGNTFNINITTGNFELETDIKKLPDIPTGSPPSTASAPTPAQNFLQNLGILSADYLAGRKESSYLKVEGEDLKKVESLSEAQLTRVDFFRQIEEQPIVGAKPYEGLITVILGKDLTPFIFYDFWSLDPVQGTTYPLKKIEQVWSAIEQGQARITFLAPANTDPFSSYEPQEPATIFVRRIFLGYFDSDKLQDYLQPIYIIDGLAMTADRVQLKFIAYLPAIADDWVRE